MKVKSEEEIIIKACRGENYKNVLEKGTPDQQYKLAECLGSAFFYEKLRQLSMKLYKKAADAGHVKASFQLYLNLREKKTATKYLHFAADAGYLSAQIVLARHYIYGEKPVYKKGFEIVKKLATKKNKDVYSIIAWCYESGKGTEIDFEKAKKYYNLLELSQRDIDRVDMLIREKENPNKKTREMIVKNYPYHYKIEDNKLVAL